ncbi:Retrovirus-related Pol polyprotein from transposon RE2 [Cardamine amara subsp. amara]|uniref:Retrovirus-related Pol polyprotein from transposon RE2 n=1 Tax=Cardamine amara subsp. amara TaxID=228776 RepID=A0ABD1AJ36_CARAN
MEQPPGFMDADWPTHVFHLETELYGLKQAPCAWYKELQIYLLSVGFKNSLSDKSLFVLRHGMDYIYLLVYVDDILVTGSSTVVIQKILTLLAERFSVKDHE